MIDPETYIQSRADAVRKYIFENEIRTTKLDIRAKTIRDLIGPNGYVTMKTADRIYHYFKDMVGYTIDVEGEQYEAWHREIVDEILTLQKQKNLKHIDVCHIADISLSTFLKIRRYDGLLRGRKLYQTYQRLKGSY